jgi:DNA-binding NtrC family response regulator/tetratricopeptide (TPR) repeat protein
MGARMAPPLLVELLGDSPGMAAVRETATRLLQRQSERGRLPPVLIQGETGVGKGLLARALHRAGPRAAGPFVDVNCAAIPETLLEAELFGYERGAFTDARHPKAGLFQVANHGTIFLDEVGLLPEALQAKLLKALEDRAVRRLGGTRLEPVDIWILTASNEDLAAAARARRFREDLYHRLAVVTMTIPPLRERGEDILRLATHFLGRACAEYHLAPRSLTPDARAALLAYPWRGNVRELVNVMERVALLSEASTVTAEQLGLPVVSAPDVGGSRAEPASSESAALADALGSVERAHLVEALRQTGGNVTRAAARLGISRDTLRYRMSKHGLGREEADRPVPPRSRAPRVDRPEAQRGDAAGETVATRAVAQGAPAVEAVAPLAIRWEGRRLAFLRSAVALPDDPDPGFSPSRALEVLLEKIQTFGGRIEEMSPTGIVAAFGLEPVEDAPQRAALAAASVHKAADRAKDSEGAGIQVRSGIVVRRVLVGASRGGTQIDLDGKREAWTVLDTLIGLAEPGAILVEEAAAAFLARHFDLTPAGHAGAAGPVQRLVASDRVGGTGLGRRAPTFVGRTRELGLLWSRLEDALRGHGQVVGLLGEAGIGKSRLLHEFRERLLAEPERRVTYLEGRCQSYASAIPYVPVMDVLRANFRIADNDGAEVIAAKVRTGIQEVGIEPAGAVPYVFRLFGIREGTETLDALTTSAVKARTFEVLRQLILQGARRRPILFVVEDLHWIDSTSEECFTTLMDSAAGVPAMCIVTYRPGYRAPWMDRSYVTQVALPPLSRDESLSVIRSARRAEAVSDQMAEVILEKAEGNPFFLEELSRVVGDGVVDTVAGPRVPDTIQEVLLARIDRLSDEPRRLLQTAAVVGQEVPLSLLGAVWEGELDPHLRELMRLEFLYVKTSGGESLCAFTHSLTCEIAYESLPLARRRALHAAIARALEASHADRLAEVYDRLAYHYGRTDDAAKAVLYLERLAKKAFAGHALSEAVRILQEARTHVDRLPASVQDRRRVELALSEAFALTPLGHFQDIVTLLLGHQVALERLDDPRLAGPYHLLLGRGYSLLGDQRQTSQHLEVGLAQAMRCGDDATRGRIHYVLAQHDAMAGRARDGLEHARQAIALLERTAESWWIGPAYWTAGMNYAILGQFDAALAAQAQATARGAEVGDPQIASSAAWASGIVHVCRGDLDAAIRSCEDALARSPDPLNTALALGWLGFAWLERGELTSAATRLEEAIRLLEQFNFRQPQAWFSAFLAETHRRAHRLETALELASKGFDLARATGSTLGIGWAERALGQIAQARGALGDAHDHFRDALHAFETVESEFEVARTHLDLAMLARARDDTGAVATHLTEAARHFRALGVARWVERVEERIRTWGAAP